MYVLARMRAEPDFFASVAREIGPALSRVADIRGAALANALNHQHPKQQHWMRVYGHMVGVNDLVPDEDG